MILVIHTWISLHDHWYCSIQVTEKYSAAMFHHHHYLFAKTSIIFATASKMMMGNADTSSSPPLSSSRAERQVRTMVGRGSAMEAEHAPLTSPSLPPFRLFMLLMLLMLMMLSISANFRVEPTCFSLWFCRVEHPEANPKNNLKISPSAEQNSWSFLLHFYPGLHQGAWSYWLSNDSELFELHAADTRSMQPAQDSRIDDPHPHYHDHHHQAPSTRWPFLCSRRRRIWKSVSRFASFNSQDVISRFLTLMSKNGQS